MKKFLWLALLLPLLAHATTPTFDTTNYFSEPSSSTVGGYTTTGSLTVTSASNLLICSAWAYEVTGGSGLPATSVTWGGVSLTLLSNIGNTAPVSVDLWYLISPTPGTHTLTTTYSMNLGGFAGIICIPVDSANVSSGASSAFGTAATAQNAVGSSITVTATGSAGANDVYFGTGSINGSSITSTGSGQTRIGTAQSGSFSIDQIAGTGGGVFAWTNSGSTTNANAIGVAIHGASAGGGSSPLFFLLQ